MSQQKPQFSLYQKYTTIDQYERALTIEAALEQVRSAAMAMHKSEELVKVATVMTTEFKKLGMKESVSAGFALIDEEKQVQYMWGAKTDTKFLQFFTMPLFGDQVLQNRFDAWKRRDPIYSTVLGPEALKKHLEVALPSAQSTDKENESKTDMPQTTYFYFGNFRQGYLQIISRDALIEEHQYILARFASVFEQAYTRFLDIQKAEIQSLRLQELDNAKTVFYTNITHEFRTPLTIILGMAAQLKTQVFESGKEGLKMIERNGQQLLRLVNQMLDLQKLESKSMPLNMIQGDLVTYVKYLVESFQSYAASKCIHIHFTTELNQIQMDYDPEKIQHIIANLLSNAIKFTEEEGTIYVTLRLDKQYFSLSIKDTGIGIGEDKVNRIFDRFYQVEDSSIRQAEGTGIGLALTKELVHLLKGEIKVKSQLGEGTEFTVRLPVTRQAKLSQTKPEVNIIGAYSNPKTISIVDNQETLISQTEKPHLLIIEDNVDVVQYLKVCLENNYQLEVAYNGKEGIEKAIEKIPDLVITDVMMPFKDGFEVCRTLKNDEKTSHIPIIMLTAKAGLNSKLTGLKKGADAYLLKPFHKEELCIRINKLLELRSTLQKHYLSITSFSTEELSIKDLSNIPSEEIQFATKLKDVVEKHLDDFDFSVKEFCKEIGMSHSQLHRKITALTGLSPNRFVRHIRLNKAKMLLQNPANNISTVAYDTGFNDSSYFGRVFKKEYGMTPLEWREKTK